MVHVPNAVGVVRVNDLQLVVEPKIPMHHLFHLFERSGAIPRLDASTTNLRSATSLWPLVATWYLSSLERVVRSGLASGYRPVREELTLVRGRVETAPTMRGFFKGRATSTCSYDEFDVDTPLNRVLRAAASAVARSQALAPELRRRATRSIRHMEGVTGLTTSDVGQAQVERHTRRYAAALPLARHVLAATGRGIEAGDDAGEAFLIRTPEMVEEALRRLAREALAGRTEVARQTVHLPGSHHSLTPDLAFGDRAVGDVKYRMWAGDWDRQDLYQIVAFATGFRVRHGVRVGFAPSSHGLSTVVVGPVSLAACDWPADPAISADEAERSLSCQLRRWWDSVAQPEDVSCSTPRS
jgi:5-methylcytosine-specific restriction endonuclease McrBC regulatory subunit McrC